MFTDSVAVAWGGGLNYYSSSTSKKVNYYDVIGIYPAYGWSKFKGSKAPSADQTPNSGVTFSFKQQYSGSMSNIAYAKNGTMTIYIGQTEFEGRQTNVISQYCHRILSISGASIDITGTPGIEVSGAYQTTDSDKTSKQIKY